MFRAVATNALLITAIAAAISTKASAIDYTAHCVNPIEGGFWGRADIEIDGTTATFKQIVPLDDRLGYYNDTYPYLQLFNSELRAANLITADEVVSGFSTELPADRCENVSENNQKALRCLSIGTVVANVTVHITGTTGQRTIEGFTADFVQATITEPTSERPMKDIEVVFGTIKGHGITRWYARTHDPYSWGVCF